jgi:hypothetical protein
MVKTMSHLWTLINRLKQQSGQLHAIRPSAGWLRRSFGVSRLANPNLILGKPLQVAFLAAKPTLSPQKKLQRTFFWLIFWVVILAGLDWLQPVPITQARSSPQDGLTIQIIGPTSITAGDIFEVQIVVNNPLPAGLFGYQFGLVWNNAAVIPVETAPTLNPDFPLVAQTDIAEGQLNVAASRQGDVPDLTGSITLLTWRFQALTASGIEAAPFDLAAVTLGQKEGTALPLAGISNLVVTIVQPARQRGNLGGNIQLEGRSPDNQGGIIVLINELGRTTTTAANGDFAFADLEYGRYTLTASSPGFLSAACANVTYKGEAAPLTGVTLLAGDLTGDGVIDVADATALGLSIGGGPGAAADVNPDGEVNVLDLILLGVNFGQSAGTHPWICQP